MHTKQIAFGIAGFAALGVFGLLAWAQRREVAALPIRPGRAGAKAAARAYAAAAAARSRRRA